MAKKDAIRARVFSLAVEGLCPADIARKLSITKSLVAYHIKILVKNGSLRKVDGPYPHRYMKGPKAAILVGLVAGEGPQATYGRGSEFNSPYHSRTHTPDPYIIDVVKVGDLHSYQRIINGERTTVPLFPTRPYIERNGVEFYEAKVPAGGGEVSVELHFGKKNNSLKIHPGEVYQTRDDIERVTEPFLPQVNEVLNELSKHAGWQFGERSWKGTIHYAFFVDGLEICIAPGKCEGWWVDRSPGYSELETDHKEFALMWLDAIREA